MEDFDQPNSIATLTLNKSYQRIPLSYLAKALRVGYKYLCTPFKSSLHNFAKTYKPTSLQDYRKSFSKEILSKNCYPNDL